MTSSDVITGNYFDKFSSTNPLVRFVMKRYLSRLYDLLDRGKTRKVLEVGCGEGEIVSRIVQKYEPEKYFGYDIDEEYIHQLQKQYPEHTFGVENLEDFVFDTPVDVAICVEVLEHIKDYPAALESLSNLPASRFVISVPNEPFFRLANIARFHYLSRLGNTPGHVNNFSLLRIRRLVQNAFPKKRVRVFSCWIWSFVYVE